MWLFLLAAAEAGGTCEAMCARVGACVGETSAPAMAECATSCRASGVGAEALGAIAAAPTCDDVLLALAMASAGMPQPAPAAPTNAAPSPTAPAAPAASGKAGACRKPATESQLGKLVLSSAWCSFSYTGGTTRTSRFQFARDGRVGGGSQRESAYTGANTNQYGDVTQTWGAVGSSSSAEQGCWDVVGNALAFSADGVTYVPASTSVTRNSNGYPIVTVDGTEYSQCQ